VICNSAGATVDEEEVVVEVMTPDVDPVSMV
jgi:hypothetical protein